MPPSLAAANIATAWWPEAAWGTFLLLTMRGASMSYHVSLEHSRGHEPSRVCLLVAPSFSSSRAATPTVTKKLSNFLSLHV